MVASHIASLPQTTGITSHPPSDAIDQQQKLTSPVNNTYGNMAIEKGFATSEVGGDEDRTKTTEMLHLKKHFFYATLMASCIAAFAVGRIARICILDVAQRNLLTIYNNQVTEMHRMEKFISLQHNSAVTAMMTLPDPVMKQGKVIPRTTYTSKNFDTRSATTHSRWIVSDTRQEKCSVFRDSPECTPTPATIIAEDPILEEHLPSGQHLLLDLENIDSHFLNSEERLASAMLDLVDQCGLTLLSYHCHHLQPSGVSCAGVLLESHVSFHTWPSRGVITIDLFTCGSKSLLPIVPIVEKLFAVPSSKVSNNEPLPKMVWAHKYRGFGDHADRAEVTDMFHFPVGQMSDFKQEVGKLNCFVGKHGFDQDITQLLFQIC
jgi:S-adenosylmethionine decarboxylase proenzyme